MNKSSRSGWTDNNQQLHAACSVNPRIHADTSNTFCSDCGWIIQPDQNAYHTIVSRWWPPKLYGHEEVFTGAAWLRSVKRLKLRFAMSTWYLIRRCQRSSKRPPSRLLQGWGCCMLLWLWACGPNANRRISYQTGLLANTFDCNRWQPTNEPRFYSVRTEDRGETCMNNGMFRIAGTTNVDCVFTSTKDLVPSTS
jgi:hypothetical protein